MRKNKSEICSYNHGKKMQTARESAFSYRKEKP